MAELTVYGASDDLIEIEGDISDEFTYDHDEPNFLAFSDGTLIEATYTQSGRWAISVLANGDASSTKEDALSDEGRRNDGRPAYSDVVTLVGPVTWVVFGHQRALLSP